MEWVRHLQEALRSPWLDSIFKAWDFADSAYFSILVIALVWYLWDQRIGTRLLYILIISLAVNKILKGIFDLPRPCQIDPLAGILCGRRRGFPAGQRRRLPLPVLCSSSASGLFIVDWRSLLHFCSAFPVFIWGSIIPSISWEELPSGQRCCSSIAKAFLSWKNIGNYSPCCFLFFFCF